MGPMRAQRRGCDERRPEARGDRHPRLGRRPREESYGRLGWRLDGDFAFDNGVQIVQFTPPGSPGSIQFGAKMTSATPGSAENLYLIVSDIEAARDELVARGAEVSDVFHPGSPRRAVPAADASDRPQRTRARSRRATARSQRSATRTETAGCCRRSRAGFPAAWTPARRRSPRQRSCERAAACRGRPRRARAAHREAGRELARVVRRVHRGGAGRRGAAGVTPAVYPPDLPI